MREFPKWKVLGKPSGPIFEPKKLRTKGTKSPDLSIVKPLHHFQPKHYFYDRTTKTSP
jgi:hypothetical protein